MTLSGLVSIVPVREEAMASSPPPLPEHSQESILIYLSMSGSVVPMRVLKSDSIEAVKLRIQTCKGIFTRNQKLVCGGKELARKNSLLEDYGVSNGNVLHLVLRLSDLQVINVRTCCGKEFTFHVEGNRDIGYVKRQIAKRNSETVEDEEVFLDGEPIDDQRLLADISNNNTEATIHLFVRKNSKIRASPFGKNFELSIVASQPACIREHEKESGHNSNVPRIKPTLLLEPLIVNPKIELPPEITDLVNSTLDGLDKGNYPIRSSEGTGGSYFMLDQSGSKYLSVFKPADEEPMAVNNPRGLPLSRDGEGLKRGTRVGEGGIRECAVYLLDRGFAGVPPTVYVRCLHEGFNHPGGRVCFKSGSLQMFVENNGSCEDVGPGAFPVEEVHKIAVLDMRVANADRHAGNILVSKGTDGETVLVPIDHGYCLPCSFEDCTFDWLYWPQAQRHFSTNTIEYIRSLDAEEDIALLKFYGWDPPIECARVLRISTMLLKKGTEKGLTPFAIGNIMCRETLNKESAIEEIIREARDSMLSGSTESAFLDRVSSIMDSRLKEIV